VERATRGFFLIVAIRVVGALWVPFPVSNSGGPIKSGTSGSLNSGTTVPLDSSSLDSGSLDSGSLDSGSLDSGSLDSGSLDSGSLDSGSLDLGSLDSGSLDSGSLDSGSLDAGSLDSGTVAGCDRFLSWFHSGEDSVSSCQRSDILPLREGVLLYRSHRRCRVLRENTELPETPNRATMEMCCVLTRESGSNKERDWVPPSFQPCCNFAWVC
jgi:hypothetical protein